MVKVRYSITYARTDGYQMCIFLGRGRGLVYLSCHVATVGLLRFFVSLTLLTLYPGYPQYYQ